MGGELSIGELAQRTGEPVKRLRRWRSLGFIGREDIDAFTPEDVERVRLVQLFLRRGISLEDIAQAAKNGILDRFVEMILPAGTGPAYSLAEAAEVVGLDVELVRRVWMAPGFLEQGEVVGGDDLDGLRLLKAASEAGFPEEALMQFVRVYSDALGRVAETEARLFHFYIHEGLKAEGLSGRQLREASSGAGNRAASLVEPVVLFFHRRAWQRALREIAVMQVAEQSGLLEKGAVPGQLQAAIAFVDLCSFTPLADAMGDAAAAQVLTRFSALVREAAGRWEGRVVKQIGDAFMLAFPEVRSAVACALEIEGRTAAEPQFPASRSGVHWGTVLYRDGDYVGSTVNIASRLATEAERHQVLVTAEVSREAHGLAEVDFVPLGKRQLKGVGDELELFEARPRAVGPTEKAVDPVCGMELSPAEVAARLALEGKERAFCSEECLRRFVAAPERYS
jgi:class 3 adenylate cyclase/YHS domain-containing protein